MDAYLQWLPSLMLGIALSSAAGFRIFLPLLAANIGNKFGLLPFTIGNDFTWLASNQATLILGIAAAAEVMAYYVPFIDNILDTIAAPAALAAGTVLTTSILQIDDQTTKWVLGVVAGGGIATTISAGTGLLRLASSKFTGGTGNVVVSTTENILSVSTIIFSFIMPTLIGISVVLLAVWILKKIFLNKNQ